jgi:hypothetical protein
MGLFEHKPRSPATTPPRQALPSVAPPTNALAGASGQPLDAATRAPFERGFGVDFASVRVHADSRASESARALHALAYTVGRDIVFRDGAFAPHTPGGRRLLAHELAHVAQQGASGAVRPFRPSIAAPDAPEERAADQAADAVVRGAPVPRLGPAAAVIHRTPDPADGTEAVHEDLVEAYRRAMGYPPRGIGPDGERVGPSDTEIRFSLLEPWLRSRATPSTATPAGTLSGGGNPAVPSQAAAAAGPAPGAQAAVGPAPAAQAPATPAAAPAARYDPAHPPAWALGPWTNPDGTARQTPRGYGRHRGWYDPHVPVVPSGPAVPGNLPPGARGARDGLRWAFYGDEIRVQQRIPWDQVVGGRTGRRVLLSDPATARDTDGMPVEHDSHGIVQAESRDAGGIIVGDQGWLHNNPGEMRGGGTPTRGRHARAAFAGALGVGEGNSVVFGSEQAGRDAIRRAIHSAGTESLVHRMCRWDHPGGRCDPLDLDPAARAAAQARWDVDHSAEETRLRAAYPTDPEAQRRELTAWLRTHRRPRTPAYVGPARRILGANTLPESAAAGTLPPAAMEQMVDFVAGNETPGHGHVYRRGDTNLPAWVRDIFDHSPPP